MSTNRKEICISIRLKMTWGQISDVYVTSSLSYRLKQCSLISVKLNERIKEMLLGKDLGCSRCEWMATAFPSHFNGVGVWWKQASRHSRNVPVFTFTTHPPFLNLFEAGPHISIRNDRLGVLHLFWEKVGSVPINEFTLLLLLISLRSG